MEQTSPSNWINAKLGASPYQLVRLLGAGPLADVYLAEDLHQGRKVVVKLLRPDVLARSTAFAARLAEEGNVVRRLEHPHLLRVLDQSEFEGRPYLVLPHCGAGNLKIRMLTGPNGQLDAKPPENLASWLPGVAQALDFLHGQGIVHRDVKPSAILFDEAGKAHLAEATLTRACFDPLRGHLTRLDAASFGTPRYMAPELIEEQKMDGRGDQFSLAMIAWEWLSGRSLFRGESAAEVSAIHRMVLSFLPPWVPGPWKTVLRRALSRKPEERYATCQEFATEMLARLDAAPGHGEDAAASFDILLPEEPPAPAPPPPPAPVPPVPRTTVVETRAVGTATQINVEDTRLDQRRLPVDPLATQAQKTMAEAARAHDEVAAWFVIVNATNFSLSFQTRGKNWMGAWTAWTDYSVGPNKVMSLFCQGAIRVELRYNVRLAGGLEHEVANIAPQLWPAAARPKLTHIGSRYRFVIEGPRVQLELEHRPVDL